MLVEIQKTETREIVLTSVKYVCFADVHYYRFTPLNDNIEVLSFFERDDPPSFELSVRVGLYESQVGILELTRQFSVEITEDEFNVKLQDLLLHYI